MKKDLLTGLLALVLLPITIQAQAIVAKNFNGAWTKPNTLNTVGTTST